MVPQSLNATAVRATLHCLAGCSIGEVLGMVISTALGWGMVSSIALAVALAFVFGYALSIIPILKFGLGLAAAAKVAVVADTASILTMEVVDNAFLLIVPGAMHATLDTVLFWVSLTASLMVAFVVALPVNRWLIARGKGHAVAHAYHSHGHESHSAQHSVAAKEDECCEHPSQSEDPHDHRHHV